MGLEYKIEKIEQKILDRVVCDRCKKEVERISDGGWNQFGEPYSVFHPPSFKDFFLLETSWGYFSSKDGDKHEAVLCEPCYDEVFKGVDIKIENNFMEDILS
jgi:hypothetical protein